MKFKVGDRVQGRATRRFATVIEVHNDTGNIQARYDSGGEFWYSHPERSFELVAHSVTLSQAAAGINPKDIIGATKPDLSLVPSALVIQVAEAMRNGASKYGAYNWREKQVQAMTYLAAAQRHILQYLDGEDYAEDSGVHHLAHAAAGFGIVLDALATGNLVDNRPVKGAASALIADLTRGGK